MQILLIAWRVMSKIRTKINKIGEGMVFQNTWNLTKNINNQNLILFFHTP